MTIAQYTKKIAICNANPSLELLKPWGNLADMGIEMFEARRDGNFKGVEYEVFEVYNNEIPPVKQLMGGDYIGIHITGSVCDAHDTETEWVNNLREMLRALLKENGHPPVSAICFGHQMLASALGCKVARNCNGYEGGITRLEISEDALDSGVFQNTGLKKCGKQFFLAESH